MNTKLIALPPPNPNVPMIGIVFTDNIVPGKGHDAAATIQWSVSKAHPFVPGMHVVRMFVTDDGVEVYSSSDDGKTCMRDLISSKYVRLVQEAMTVDVFVRELQDAEDDEDDPEPDPEPAPSPGAVS